MAGREEDAGPPHEAVDARESESPPARQADEPDHREAREEDDGEGGQHHQQHREPHGKKRHEDADVPNRVENGLHGSLPFRDGSYL